MILGNLKVHPPKIMKSVKSNFRILFFQNLCVCRRGKMRTIPQFYSHAEYKCWNTAYFKQKKCQKNSFKNEQYLIMIYRKTDFLYHGKSTEMSKSHIEYNFLRNCAQNVKNDKKYSKRSKNRQTFFFKLP